MALTYDEAISFIHERSGYDRGYISNPFAGDDAARLGLVRTESLLDELGRPDRAYPIIHVAGSKGKGSTSSILASILTASGLKAGRFLSPHLHRFNERFAIDGVVIADDAFALTVDRVRVAALEVERQSPEIGQLTAWELSTAIALFWFQTESCRAVVLEVGMGGTLDATNVIQPTASLITRLDLEHTAILGSTIGEIASNKAGIIKRDAPAFSVSQEQAAVNVIAARAREVGAPLFLADRDWIVTGSSDDFSFRGQITTLEHLSVWLEGRHQVENAGLAIAALTTLATTDPAAFPLAEESIRTGLASVSLAGRFEVVELDERTTIVIDGAHTPASMTMLAEAIAARFPDQHIQAIVGLLTDKSPADVLSPLMTVVDNWTVTAPESPRAMPATDVAVALEQLGVAAQISSSVATALDCATDSFLANDRRRTIVVTGSLTTVAEARAALGLTE